MRPRRASLRPGRRSAVLLGAATILGSLVLGVAIAAAVAPTVTIEGATGVGYTTAHVSGIVNPNGGPTPPAAIRTFFEYTKDPVAEPYGSSFIEGPELSESEAEGNTPIAVQGELTGLQPGTEYHVRLTVLVEGEVNSTETTFTTKTVAKPTVSIDPVTTFDATTATFVGEINPNGTDPAFETSWTFECVDPGAECASLSDASANPSGPPVAPGISAQEVTAAATLVPNTTYFVKLVAKNLGGTSEATENAGQPVSFTTPAVAPTVVFAYQGATTATETTLYAFVNPRHSALSTCAFEYGPAAGIYGHSVPCTPDPGTANEPVLAAADLTGLAPESEYHYRIRAESPAGPAETPDGVFSTGTPPSTAACPNQVLRVEQHATFLPDCRAYELVSPPDKNGGDVTSYTGGTRAAADGSAVEFRSRSNFGDVHGTSIVSEYMSIRDPAAGANGWVTHNLDPKLEPGFFFDPAIGNTSSYFGEFSPDLEDGIFRTKTPLNSESPDTAAVPKLYLRTDLRSPGEGHYQLITACPACTEPLPENPEDMVMPAGASADFTHVIFDSAQSLTADIPPCTVPGGPPGPNPPCTGYHLFEWTANPAGGGTVTLAGVLPGGAPAPNSHAGEGVAEIGGGFPGAHDHPTYAPNTISRDGRRVFFTVTPETADPANRGGQLYLRTDNGEPNASTVRISASEQTTPDPCETEPETCPTAHYAYATPDGMHAFFTTTEHLLDADTSAGGREQLYEYNVIPDAQGHHLRLLSAADPGHQAGVAGVIGVSDDGSYVYFTTKQGQLLAGHPEGQNFRIYLWHDGVLHEVANLSENSANYASGEPYGRALTPKFGRVSPDGRHLLFPAAGNPDSPHSGLGDACPTQESGAAGCIEVFLYDAGAGGGRLICASCRQGQPSAPLSADAGIYTEIGLHPGYNDTHLNHPLSVTGRYAFFSTADALLPEDTNGVSDVYEYDTRTGGLALISSGTYPSPSYFMEASESGEDVFFTTRQSLVGWDTDGTGYDLYDARVGGGVSEPPAIPAPCAGATCRGSAASAPSVSGAASSSFRALPTPSHRSSARRALSRSTASASRSRRRQSIIRRARSTPRSEPAPTVEVASDLPVEAHGTRQFVCDQGDRSHVLAFSLFPPHFLFLLCRDHFGEGGRLRDEGCRDGERRTKRGKDARRGSSSATHPTEDAASRRVRRRQRGGNRRGGVRHRYSRASGRTLLRHRRLRLSDDRSRRRSLHPGRRGPRRDRDHRRLQHRHALRSFRQCLPPLSGRSRQKQLRRHPAWSGRRPELPAAMHR